MQDYILLALDALQDAATVAALILAPVLVYVEAFK